MHRPELPPAIDGVEQRLDVLIDLHVELLKLLAPAERQGPEDGMIELREPEVKPAQPARSPAARAKRR